MKNVSSKDVKEALIDLVKTVVISFVVVFIITSFLFKPVRVDGSSMYPTLLDNSIGLAGIITKSDGISRFDVVTIYLEDKDEYLVKRVIGLPNEKVEFIDNVLYIDGNNVDEDFLISKQESDFLTYTENFSIQLSDNEYFCMGDNRLNSRDSREYGPFLLSQIKTEGLMILLPFDRFGVIN